MEYFGLLCLGSFFVSFVFVLLASLSRSSSIAQQLFLLKFLHEKAISCLCKEIEDTELPFGLEAAAAKALLVIINTKSFQPQPQFPKEKKKEKKITTNFGLRPNQYSGLHRPTQPRRAGPALCHVQQKAFKMAASFRALLLVH